MTALITIFNAFTLIIIFVFSGFLYAKSATSKVAQALLHVFIAIVFWLIFEFSANLIALPDNVSLLLWRLTFAAVFIMAILAFRFVLILTGLRFNKYVFYFLFIIQSALAYLSVSTNKIIFSINQEALTWGKDYILGDYFIWSSLAIVFPLILSLIYLAAKWWKIRNDQDKNEKANIVYIFLGFIFPVIIGSVTNLLFPYLGIDFPKLAGPALIFLVFFCMYAIYQWQALSITVGRLKINQRIVIMFLLISFFAIAIGTSFLSSQSDSILKNEMYRQLENRVKSRNNSLDYYLSENLNLANVISSLYSVHDYLLSTSSGNSYSEAEQTKVSELLKTINSFYKPVLDIGIINTRGQLISTVDQDTLNISQNGLSQVVNTGKYFYSDVRNCSESKNPCFEIIYPVFDGQKIMGAVILNIDMSRVYSIVTENLNTDPNEELYLVNKDGYIISPIGKEGIAETFLKVKANNEIIETCYNQGQDTAGGIAVAANLAYANYGKLKSQGALSYISGIDWCLVGEYNISEVNSYISHKLFNDAIIAVLIVMLLVIFFSRYLASTISKPIMKLQEDIKEIEQGNLDYKVGTDARDEIGDLSRAFDHMTAAIKKSREDVDRKVKEQTAEIREKEELLEDQQRAVLNVLEDVEKEKELTLQERDKIDTIIHSIGDGVFVIDENLRIVLFNQVAADISGYDNKEAIGQPFDKVLKFIDEKTGEKADSFIQEVLKTGEAKKMSNHTILINKTGEKVAVSDSASPVKNKEGEVIGCVVVFHDVTKEREVDKAKTEFVSLSSHQLRTPLTSINWYTEMLLSGDAGKLNNEQKEYLGEIYEGTHRMVDLVNSLLNVSRIELGTFAVEPAPTDFIKLGQDIIKELKPTIEAKKMNVQFEHADNMPIINADPKLTRMIFQNLMSNAVKYTPEKGTVTLSLQVKKPNILIKVTDTGFGIPKEAKDKIFTKLYRADNVRAKDTTGTGLGLYIIKSIIDKNKGKIWFESAEDKGTTFYVELPLSGFIKTEGTKPLT